MNRFAVFALLTSLLATCGVFAGDKPVKLFVLAGQSNMEGKAPNALYELQASDPATAASFSHLRKDGKWIVRDDVFVKFLERRGPLTVGFGSPDRTGIELEFGTILGDSFAEPVVLVKAAWGGRSLCKDFRPPSAGLPPTELLRKELEQKRENVQKRNEKAKREELLPTLDGIKTEYGISYRAMLEEVRNARDHCGEIFPALKGRTVEVAGFVWFQGWNDQYGGQAEYAANLAHLIRDVRHDLGKPGLPVVVLALGQNGSKPASGPMLTIQRAQLAIAELPEFRGSVKALRTDTLVDKTAEDLFPTWRENKERWDRTGGDFPYHYLGSAIWFNRMGRAAGTAMLELLKHQE